MLNNILLLNALVFLSVLILMLKKRQTLKMKKSFYNDFFKLQKTTSLKIKLFGNLNEKTIRKIRPFTTRLQKIFGQKMVFFGDLSFKFSSNKKGTRIEANYFSKDSLHLFYEENSGTISLEMKLLVDEVEESGGEAVMSTRFKKDGSIDNSSLILYLPC